MISSGHVRVAYAVLLQLALGVTSSADTLTLEKALLAAESPHPELEYKLAELDGSVAELGLAGAQNDLIVNLEGILRSGRPSIGGSGYAADNSVRLTARKTLYDFGRTSNSELAAEQELSARKISVLAVIDSRRLEIMARYFDVLLADMQYTVDNELMAVSYVTFDQGKDRLERGQISIVDLAELESGYRDTLDKRIASAQRQRITRTLLANAMNQPGKLPGELEDPELPGNHLVIPDYEALLPIMRENNLRLRAQRKLLEASQSRLTSMRSEYGPVLDAELQAGEYSRDALTRDNYSAGLILNWPLYQGARTDSRISRQMAEYNKLQAESGMLEMGLAQTLLEVCLEIDRLRVADRQSAEKYADYKDLLLERSRGLYELELKSNLGTSMAGTVEAKLRQRRIEYLLALNIARLEALLGKAIAELGNIERDGHE